MTTPHAVRASRLALAAILLFAVAPSAPAAELHSSVESLLTPDSIGFLHVRIGDVWDSPGLAFYRKMLASLGAESTKAFDARFAPNPSQFDTVTIIMPSLKIQAPIPNGRPVGETMLWAITTKQPIDRVDLVKALGPDARTKSHRGADYLFDESHWAGVMLLDRTTLVAGSEDAIVRLIEQRENARGIKSPLGRIFAREAARHTALLGVNPSVFAVPEILRGLPEPFTPLVKASRVWAALDMKQETRLSVTMEFGTPQQAAAGKLALEIARKMALDLIATGIAEMDKMESQAAKRPVMGLLDMPGFFPPIVGKAALKYLDGTLAHLPLETSEANVQTSINLTEFFPANADALAIMAFAFFAANESFSGYYSAYGYNSGPRDTDEVPYQLRDNFARIAAALQAYHREKGSFPPAALYDRDGKPLLSWRVLILPYMEQRPGDIMGPQDGPFAKVEERFPQDKPAEPVQRKTFTDLYKEFNLDEPWDSLHNKKLLEKMPRPFRADFSVRNWRQEPGWKTGMQVFTGPGTLFPGQKGVSRDQVRGGLGVTIAVAFRDDVQHAVAWTKPADMPFAANKPLPKLFDVPATFRGGSMKSPGTFVIMADGQSRRLPPDFTEKDLKGLVTTDGEKVKLPEPKGNKNVPPPVGDAP